ncbi:hypothetical protein C0995_009127 [Termitomyces sp. Mi166|nr:hypothetical protein C0995_009127 [Termitomyces sp. Mi166\
MPDKEIHGIQQNIEEIASSRPDSKHVKEQEKKRKKQNSEPEASENDTAEVDELKLKVSEAPTAKKAKTIPVIIAYMNIIMVPHTFKGKATIELCKPFFIALKTIHKKFFKLVATYRAASN